jgi:hypothetical protein
VPVQQQLAQQLKRTRSSHYSSHSTIPSATAASSRNSLNWATADRPRKIDRSSFQGSLRKATYVLSPNPEMSHQIILGIDSTVISFMLNIKFRKKLWLYKLRY